MNKTTKNSLSKKIKTKALSKEYLEFKKLENNIKKDLKIIPDNQEISLHGIKNLFKAKEYTAAYDNAILADIVELEARIAKINEAKDMSVAETALDTQTIEIEKIIDSIKK
ncbi:Uncharacterised protein [Metamycoplasma arthritidis]|uniref:Uncharacterized protein n=1 Tax=Metamycoplasma arthritidis (strain 158L3-1) TaxID=243272 RepID=B3PME0_META1|nr:hypothetical protein [Metamycoplasma arthritidis]ACF07192.1 hypothetical protein MARTH_orf300 [Metamycoplasma arthritidis 158L3-1]VEU78716.1 Uncharacterised protein [Metamycoplasma arthritidis]